MSVYVVTAMGDANEPFVAERSAPTQTIDGVPFTYTSAGPVTVGTTPMQIHHVELRPDMPPWPAPKRMTRRQRRLRGMMKAWRRATGAGVPHRMGFAAVSDDGWCVV